MRVLFLAPQASTLVARLITELGRNGVECIVATHDPIADFYGVETLSLGKLNSFFDFLKFWKVQRVVNSARPDIVHAHVLTHYGLQSLMIDTPLVITIWGSEVMLLDQENLVKRTILSVLGNQVLKKAAALHSSSSHVLAALRSYTGYAPIKANSFYWGFPLEEPPIAEQKLSADVLLNEFGIENTRKYFVFNRGLADVYQPEFCARVINRLLLEFPDEKRVIVFRSYSSANDLERFFKMVDIDRVIFVDRLLGPKELFCLYKYSVAHFNLCASDNLGAGVVEPMQLGSFPILSDIPPYRAFVQHWGGHVLKDDNHSSVKALLKMLEKPIDHKKIDTEAFSTARITAQFLQLYQRVIR